MGVWGTAVFSDDTACDIRGDYRDHLGDGLSGTEATDRILREYSSQDQDEVGVMWLALAATQWKCGRLEDRVLNRALEIIESGSDLERWKESGLVQKRHSVLLKLREQLLQPQPPARRIPKRHRSTCDWKVGELIGYQTTSKKWIVLRVTDFSADKGGVYPQCEILDWSGEHFPPIEDFRQFPIRIGRKNLHGQFSLGLVPKRKFQERFVRLNQILPPSEHSQIRIPLGGGGYGYKGGGLPFLILRLFDKYLEDEFRLK